MPKELFVKPAERLPWFLAGGAGVVAGGLAVLVYGKPAALVVAVGIGVSIAGALRGRRPLFTLGDSGIVVRLRTARMIPFASIVSIDTLASRDVELGLQGGGKVVLPLHRLEEWDGAYVRKALKKAVRLAGA